MNTVCIKERSAEQRTVREARKGSTRARDISGPREEIGPFNNGIEVTDSPQWGKKLNYVPTQFSQK